MGLLEGKVALVTGGAQGLGLAIAELFTAEGATLVIADIDGDAAAAAATDVGGGATGVAADVAAEDDVEAMVAHAVEAHGGLDVLVNNAGITRDKSVGKMTLAMFRQVIDVHLQGTWLGSRAAFAHMRDHGGGTIVNMSSVSGKVGNFGQTNYSAAKAGIVGMTKALAKEGARHGIRVNAVMPGLIRSAMTEAMPQEAWDSKLADIPMGRAGEPEEVAKAALFLASDLSSYSTGTVVEVTGGRHI